MKQAAFVIGFIVTLLRVESAWGQVHINLRFECEVCHNTTQWSDVQFDHEQTGFYLLGQHQALSCAACHDIQDFSTARQACMSCHEDVHHDKLGSDCRRCHTAEGWRIINMLAIHETSRFPLMGRHAVIDCQSCHVNEQADNFRSLATECISCHTTEFMQVQSPNHLSAQFSRQCQDCHNMLVWRPAVFRDHDPFFPIFSGKHKGEWDDCTTCHTIAGNFALFTCFSCHEHRQDKMDREHDDVSGYAYESSVCYTCHPTGSEEEGEGKKEDDD